MSDLAEAAEMINALHEGSQATRALAKDYRLVGLAGEAKLAELLGIEFEVKLNGGDGGRDLMVKVQGRSFSIDVKTSRRPELGLLVAKPARADIYVLMSFPELVCWGWQWRSLVERCPVVDKGHNVPSYDVPFPLRDLLDLQVRINR